MIEKNKILPTGKNLFIAGKVECAKCGRELNSIHNLIKGANKSYYCDCCYQKMLFPYIKETNMEMLD